MFLDIFIYFACLFRLFGTHCPSAGYEGKTVYSFFCIVSGKSYRLVTGYQRIDFRIGMVMSGLCAPFAVFAAPSAAGIHNGTDVEMIA